MFSRESRTKTRIAPNLHENTCVRVSSLIKEEVLINTIFSCKNVFAATEIQQQPPQGFYKRRSAALLSGNTPVLLSFKNTYFEKHL